MALGALDTMGTGGLPGSQYPLSRGTASEQINAAQSGALRGYASAPQAAPEASPSSTMAALTESTLSYDNNNTAYRSGGGRNPNGIAFDPVATEQRKQAYYQAKSGAELAKGLNEGSISATDPRPESVTKFLDMMYAQNPAAAQKFQEGMNNLRQMDLNYHKEDVASLYKDRASAGEIAKAILTNQNPEDQAVMVHQMSPVLKKLGYDFGDRMPTPIELQGMVLMGHAANEAGDIVTNREKFDVETRQKDRALDIADTSARAKANMNGLDLQEKQLSVLGKAEQITQPKIKELRNDYDKKNAPIESGLNAINNIDSLMKQPFNPASQKALLYNIARLFNGTGVLTDKDLKAVEGTGNILDKASGYIKQIMSGTPLNKNQLDSFMTMINGMGDGMQKSRKTILKETMERAKQDGVDITSVVGEDMAKLLATGSDTTGSTTAKKALAPNQVSHLEEVLKSKGVPQSEWGTMISKYKSDNGYE